MRRYQQIYDEAVSKRYLARDKYAKMQFSSPEIVKFNRYKRVKKDILYFYLIGIVAVAVVLAIICTKHNDLFTKIWLTYIAILALNTIIMVISLGLIKQIMENKAFKARSKEESIQEQALITNDDLAKTCICLLALENHNCYLNEARKNGELEKKTSKLIDDYIEIINQNNNNLATSDDFITFYQEKLAFEEKNASK